MLKSLPLLTAGLLSFSTVAETVNDLSGWIVEDAENTDANWEYVVETNTWKQMVNTTDFTYLYDPSSTSLGKAVSGTISVNTGGDDDYIGFVLGYQPGDLMNENADYLLLTWKQATQGNMREGMTLYHVQGSLDRAYRREYANTNNLDFIPYVEMVGGAGTYASVGWEDFTPYSFDIAYEKGYLAVFVNDVMQYSLTPGEIGKTYFDEGAFGFYNYSQNRVEYGSVIYDDVSVLIDDDKMSSIAAAVPFEGNAAVALLVMLVGAGGAHKRKKSV